MCAGPVNNCPRMCQAMELLTSNGGARLGSRHFSRLELQRDGAISAGFPLESGGLSGLELVTTVRDLKSIGLVGNSNRCESADNEIEGGTHIDSQDSLES